RQEVQLAVPETRTADPDAHFARTRLRHRDVADLRLGLPADELDGAHQASTVSSTSANLRRAASRRFGTYSVGRPSSGASYARRICRATDSRCTSSAPSTKRACRAYR